MALALGTNGVRGLYDELNPSTAMDFGYAFAHFVRHGAIKPKDVSKSRFCVCLARDMRRTSPALAQAAAAGLMEGGCDVLDIGIAPSPLAEWASGHYRCDGLVIVTASHNPPEWNALKFVDGEGVAVSRQRGEGFSKYVGKPHEPPLEWQEVGKLLVRTDAIEEYRREVLAIMDRAAVSKKKFRIVADVGNGTSVLVAPDLLRALGAEVEVLNGKLDGLFPGRPSEPTEANVKKLIGRVPKEKADFGVAWDGDADRVVFVDGKGRWMVGDKCVALISEWALATLRREGKKTADYCLVTTLATSKVVEEVARKYGARVEYSDVGAPYLAERMHELGEKVAGGGEEVGGIVWPRFSLAKDGVLAACKLMEMVAQKPLAEWHDGLPRYYNAKTKIRCAPGRNHEIIKRFAAGLKSDAAAKKGILREVEGGVRLDFENSWVLSRASGTEDYIRVFAESNDEKKADELMNEYKTRVQESMKN